MIFSIGLTAAFVATALAAPLSWCEMGGKVVDCNTMYNPRCMLGGKVVDCDRMAEGELFFLTHGSLPALITLNPQTLKFANSEV